MRCSESDGRGCNPPYIPWSNMIVNCLYGTAYAGRSKGHVQNVSPAAVSTRGVVISACVERGMRVCDIFLDRVITAEHPNIGSFGSSDVPLVLETQVQSDLKNKS